MAAFMAQCRDKSGREYSVKMKTFLIRYLDKSGQTAELAISSKNFTKDLALRWFESNQYEYSEILSINRM